MVNVVERIEEPYLPIQPWHPNLLAPSDINPEMQDSNSAGEFRNRVRRSLSKVKRDYPHLFVEPEGETLEEKGDRHKRAISLIFAGLIMGAGIIASGGASVFLAVDNVVIKSRLSRVEVAVEDLTRKIEALNTGQRYLERKSSGE